MADLDPAIASELRRAVGDDHVLIDPSVTAGYAIDWTRRFRGDTAAVVRPATAEQTAEVLSVCARRGLAVVPQGGNTGLVAGALAYGGAITLSMSRLDRIEPPQDDAVSAGAGATLARLQAAARAAGRMFAVDLGARDSATTGGMVATNAGGMHVMRWGPMRSQLIGVEAVLADGSIIRDMRGLKKDNTGLYWPSILCGSEGVLAVVTQVRLRLVDAPADEAVALIGFGSVGAALRALDELRHATPDLSALELVTRPCLALTVAELGLAPPFAELPAVTVLAEVRGAHGAPDRLASSIGELANVIDAVVAADARQSASLWTYRDRITEAIARVGPAHKLDVTLPAEGLAGFIDSVPAFVAARRPSATVWLFGHAGDGNIHVNITGVPEDDHELDRAVLEEVARRGGSISAEHGIGRLKREFLEFNRDRVEIALMRRVKHAFDPAGILNPGVMI